MADDTEGQGTIETADPQPSTVVDIGTRTPEPEPDAETIVDADDVDAQALAVAEAAVAAEDDAGDPPTDPEPDPPADPPADPEPDPRAATPDPEPDPEPEPDPAAAAADSIQVPKARLDAVSSQRDKNAAERDTALQTAAYWKGRADAQAGPQSGDPDAQPKLTAAEQIQALRQEEIALTTQFDDGALSLTDVTTRQHAIQDQIASLREESNPAPAKGEDAYMSEGKAKLVDTHPYIAKLSNKAIEYLEERVLEKAVADGRPIGRGDAELMRFRTLVAEASDVYGPGMLGEQPSAPTPPSGGKEPTPAEELAAARRRKLEQGANAPPDTSQLGANNDDTTDLLQDADRLSAMTSEEREELPLALIEKALAS